MFRRTAAVVLAVTAGVASCAKSPTSPAGSTTVTSPVQVSPANGALIANGAQPVTLAVANALVTSVSAAITYTFEVATDSSFATLATAKDVPEGGNGQTSVTLGVLPAGRDYFWRVRTTGGDTVGTFSAARRFTIGAAVVLQAPVPSHPSSGSAAGQRPTLTVTNAARTGPAGAVSYRFEIAATEAFSPVVASGTVAEGTGTTSFTPSADLAADSTFYWRAQALDPSSASTSAFSSAQSFTTVATIDLRMVNYQRFPNVSSWPETNRIISVDQDGGGDGPMCIDHTKRGLWPTTPFLGDPNNHIEGNQWYFARINGQWYAGAGEWLRPGQLCKSGQLTTQIGPDGTWGGPMDTWVPRIGELVGYMVTTPARAYPDMKTLDERSNVVVLPWKENGRTSRVR